MGLSAEVGTGRVIECNQTLLDTLAHSKDDILKMTVFDVYHPDALNKVKENPGSFTRTIDIVHSELLMLK